MIRWNFFLFLKGTHPKPISVCAHCADRKPEGKRARLLTPPHDARILNAPRPDGGTGRRKGLKIPEPQGCAGSIPALGTKLESHKVP